MFIGHFALGFAAKRVVPRVSLAMLFVAAQLADILWPVFLALGLEHVRVDASASSPFLNFDFIYYPYSHSLLFLIIWGAALGFIYRAFVPGTRAFFVIAALVVSHWVLDVVTHRPDMPLYPGSVKVGLGLWHSVAATLAVELVLYAAGLWVYARATRAKDAIGRWGFISLAIFLVVVYIASIGSVPPSLPLLYISALIGAAVLIAWGWWADSHREDRDLSPSPRASRRV
ncbi:MAG TPA: hypothetical protein VKB50_05990 [Vicinamibacterales bacterium]|nr:hypothetical protein [Vicinamibacterales bacterium]